jgi:hypothetical protein
MTKPMTLEECFSKISDLEKVIEELNSQKPLVEMVADILAEDENFQRYLKSEDARFFRELETKYDGEGEHHGQSMTNHERCLMQPLDTGEISTVPQCIFDHLWENG